MMKIARMIATEPPTIPPTMPGVFVELEDEDVGSTDVVYLDENFSDSMVLLPPTLA